MTATAAPALPRDACACGATSKAVMLWGDGEKVTMAYLPEGWEMPALSGRPICPKCVRTK